MKYKNIAVSIIQMFGMSSDGMAFIAKGIVYEMKVSH